MYRKDMPIPEPQDFNIDLTMHGLGDAIAALPTVKYILDNHHGKNHFFHFWFGNHMVDLVKFCFPEHQEFIFGMKDEALYKELPTFSTRIVALPTFLRMHLTDWSSTLIADTILAPEEKNYIRPDISKHKFPKALRRTVQSELEGKRYIIITCMYTSDTRVFKAQEVNKIVAWCLLQDIVPVFVGKEHIEVSSKHDSSIVGKVIHTIDYSKGLNLFNKTSLIDLIKLMDNAVAVIGIDNGLLHLAAMTDVTIIGGYTTVKPEHRLPYRHSVMGWNYKTVVPEESLGCRFCQSNWAYDIKQNFTKCFYVEQGLDTTIKCSDQITAEKFIKILEEAI